MGEQPSELSRSLFEIYIDMVKPELSALGIKPVAYHNIELTNDFWFTNLNDQLKDAKVNYLIVLTCRRLPPTASQFKKLKSYSEASMHIGHYVHEIFFNSMHDGSYVIEDNGNFEDLFMAFSKEVNLIKKNEPLYFDTNMFIPEFLPQSRTIGRTYSNFPKNIGKEKIMIIKLDPYDSPDWKELNPKHIARIKEVLPMTFVEIRKNQIDEYKSQGYRYLIEPFNEMVFADDGKGNKGFATHYYYYLRDSKTEDKYSVGAEGFPTLSEALDGFLWQLNKFLEN